MHTQYAQPKQPSNVETFIRTHPLNPERLTLAKAAYTTRRVKFEAIRSLLSGHRQPRPGDLVLARVETIGHHSRIELADGRRARLTVGDEIVLTYGNRYAPDLFESKVPEDLASCHLVAEGGIASACVNRHTKATTPTKIRPLGLLGDTEGKTINIANWAIPSREVKKPRPFVVAVVGTSTYTGKTNTAAHLICGLARSGKKVGGAKLTGTGAGGDRWLMLAAGATHVVDFTDVGFASTYLASIHELEHIQTQLMAYLQHHEAEVIVLEVADSLFQRETSMLLESSHFKANVDLVVFAADDAMGALGGADWLLRRNLPLVALSGKLSTSPLATREATQMTELPVLGLDQLASPDITELLGAMLHWPSGRAPSQRPAKAMAESA